MLGSLGFFLITLDILIVNVALTRIGRELGGGTAGQQWVIDALHAHVRRAAAVRGQPRRPHRGEAGGRRRASSLFLVASIGCALAPTLGRADRGPRRAGRGRGGDAARVDGADPGGVPRPAGARRTRSASGRSAAPSPAPPGPLLGGLLTTLDWRLVFGINVPACVLMLVLLARVLPLPRGRRPFDWAGQALVARRPSTALMFGLITGGHDGFGRPDVVAALAVAVLAPRRVRARAGRGCAHPMLPLELLRPRGMRIALLVGFAFMVEQLRHASS